MEEIAAALTNWENHQTQEHYEDALIIKRFCFEAFDCYIALFYLAFCQNDIVLLQSELISLYTVDSIRRIAIEVGLPSLLHRVSKKRDDSLAKKTDLSNNRVLRDELELDEYEQFDDYMEMVIEFGYIVLFAAAFPLASMLSILSNLIEIKSDLFKLIFVAQLRVCQI